MFDWFDGLTVVQQIYAVIAIPSTVLVILQAVLLLFGIGDGADVDVDMDADVPDSPDAFEASDGFVLFSVRGILSMLCLGAWSGIAFIEMGLPSYVAIPLSLAVGFLALYLTALLMKQMLKLQEDGSIDISNAMGKVGTVYLTVPPAGRGHGKVNLVVQERYSEFAAITEDAAPIRTGEMVRVVSVSDLGVLLVERIK